jgi:proton-coupled amino acid transporter
MSINGEREPLLEHNSDAEPAHQGTGSAFDGTISVIKICIGTGVLALPYAFQQSGIITGPLILAFVALWNAFTTSILLECEASLRLRGVNLRAERSTLSGIARHATGIVGVYILDFSLFFTTFGVCATYQITVGQLLSSTFEGMGMPYHPANQQLLMVVASVPIYLMTRLKSLEILAKTAGVALVSLFISFIIIFASGFKFPTQSYVTSSLLYAKSSNSLSIFFGIVVFSFGIPAAMFPIQEGMKDRAKFKRSLLAGLAAVYITYTVLGVLGLLLYVDSPVGVQEIILNSLPDRAASKHYSIYIQSCTHSLVSSPSTGTYTVKILQSLVCIFSTPLVWMVPGQMLDSMIPHRYQTDRYPITLTLTPSPP